MKRWLRRGLARSWQWFLLASALLAFAVGLLQGLPLQAEPLQAEPLRAEPLQAAPLNAASQRAELLQGAMPNSSYALAWRAPFNRPSYYPLDRRPDPALYRPHAEWIGRLILPQPAEAAAATEDWTWLELEQAPPPFAALVGRRLPLAWAEQPQLRALVGTLTTAIDLGPQARSLEAQGNVVPQRLDGRSRVGPLQSLAGARPHDDVTVRLEAVQVIEAAAPGAGFGGLPLLRIGSPPVQISGRWMARVLLLEALPAAAGAGADLFRVRHFDPAAHGYSGPTETVRIPTQPPNRDGRRFFDPAGLVGHPIGAEGWTLYGAPAADGIFTVQALLPLALVQLHSDQRLVGTAAGLRHLAHDNWSARATQRGRFRRTELQPDLQSDLQPDRQPRPWQIGDHALLIHSFGGIGGVGGEATPGFTVTGHFAFGEAELIADPFGGEPRFELRYHQIYANNPDGIVAGSQDWSAWSGDLQRGWLGLRPISDGLVRQDPALLAALRLQAEVLMARYRSGDGSGVAAVTATTSCVQDSAQALWTTLELWRRGVWPAPAPGSATQGPGGGDGRALQGPGGGDQRASLEPAIERVLAPFGIVRSDWRRNAELIATALTGADAFTRADAGEQASPQAAAAGRFRKGTTLLDGLLSLQTILPRRGHDQFAALFLRRGEPLWMLRSNQIPGANRRYAPLAPTLLFGRIPLLGELQRRLSDGLLAPLDAAQISAALVGIAAYGAVALGQGLGSGLLQPQHRWPRRRPLLASALGLAVMPALGEELLFRGALLPHPAEGTPWPELLACSALAIGVFVLYHPLAARCWYRRADAVFHDRRFLLQTALLGLATTLLYQCSGSLWPAVLLHWLAVLVWLERLGGRQLLAAEPSDRQRLTAEPSHQPPKPIG